MKLVYKDHPRVQQNEVLIHRWSLYAGSITQKVYPWGPVKCGLYKQVVLIYRWSLEQVWLYFLKPRSIVQCDIWSKAGDVFCNFFQNNTQISKVQSAQTCNMFKVYLMGQYFFNPADEQILRLFDVMRLADNTMVDTFWYAKKILSKNFLHFQFKGLLFSKFSSDMSS